MFAHPKIFLAHHCMFSSYGQIFGRDFCEVDKSTCHTTPQSEQTATMRGTEVRFPIQTVKLATALLVRYET